MLKSNNPWITLQTLLDYMIYNILGDGKQTA